MNEEGEEEKEEKEKERREEEEKESVSQQLLYRVQMFPMRPPVVRFASTTDSLTKISDHEWE